MTNDEFRYWINGYLMLSSEDFIDSRQISIIKNHANLVEAVMGSLDVDVIDFILRIENQIKANPHISLGTVKQIAAQLKCADLSWHNLTCYSSSHI